MRHALKVTSNAAKKSSLLPPSIGSGPSGTDGLRNPYFRISFSNNGSLIQAADLFRRGLAEHVVINGNRKTDSLRELERMGFKRCCPWDSDSVSILTMLGVPEVNIIRISNEDAYDTVSEAEMVGRELIGRNWTTVIITTSKFHSRRAKYIWQKAYEEQLTIAAVSAKTDPYDPDNWWTDARQIRWVLAEYGAWIFYWWKEITGI